jgi:methionine-gamma-lyase
MARGSGGMNDHSFPARPNRLPAFATRAIHHGFDRTKAEGALIPPIYMTSTYAFETAAESEAIAAGEIFRPLYGREENPTQSVLEARLANLEGAEACVVLASGMGAVGSLMLSLLSQGDELVVHRTLYSNTFALTQDALPRFGIKVVPVDMADPANLDGVLSASTKIIYFETPVNPTAETLDIAAIASRARAVGAMVVVDSTFASPALQRPLEHGAHLVLHALTKYINGHGDLLGGAVLGDFPTVEKIRRHGLRYITGATMSPMSAYLVMRGLKTLGLRMERHSATALRIAQMLAAHPAVATIRYPYLQSDPGYAAARRQMASGSGMLSFSLKSGNDGADRFMDRLRLVLRAVSLGDAESLIMRPGALLRGTLKVDPTARMAGGVDEPMMRLSVGLEDAEDLLDDVGQALEGI